MPSWTTTNQRNVKMFPFRSTSVSSSSRLDLQQFGHHTLKTVPGAEHSPRFTVRKLVSSLVFLFGLGANTRATADIPYLFKTSGSAKSQGGPSSTTPTPNELYDAIGVPALSCGTSARYAGDSKLESVKSQQRPSATTPTPNELYDAIGVAGNIMWDIRQICR